MINKEVLQSLNPCKDRWENYLLHHENFNGTELEFLELDKISNEDKLWVILRPEFIFENDLHEMACVFAERVLPVFEKEYPSDSQPRLAIEAKRKWLKKEISDDELAAAGDAARVATGAAARAAVWAAVYAAGDAARAAAWDTEIEFQVNHVKEYFRSKR